MGKTPDPNVGSTMGATDPRRRSERHTTEALQCDLGVIVDLSQDGMKVQVTGKPSVKVGSSGQLKIKAEDGAITVNYVVKWISRSGFRKYTLGVQFVNMRPGLPAVIDSIARFGIVRASDRVPASTGGTQRVSRAGTKPVSRRPVEGPKRITRTGFASRGIRTTRTFPDYYQYLGLPPNASPNDVQQAFHKLALRFHPDVARNPSDAEKFHHIQEAYNVLKDPDRRQAYDAKRRKRG